MESKVFNLPVVSDSQWYVDPETGEEIPPLRVRRFIEWVMDPERPAACPLNQWFRDQGMSPHSLQNWMRDPRFRRTLERRCEELNLSPDRTQRVIEVIWKKAVNGDMKAAQLYLQHVGKMAPLRQQVDVTVTHKVADLSDAQLRAEVERVMKALPAVIDVEEVHSAVQEHQATPVHAHEASRDRQQVGEGSKGQGH